MNQQRIVQQIDKMVASGRITEDEASRLRAAEGTPDFELAVGEIRARHAGEGLEPSVSSGEMTQEQADNYLDRIRSGEHPKGLRARLAKHRPRQH
ncbi:MAG TPA: hypothetical protein VMU77_04120 [Acidimicrobiales bacterium]|nr:hypothetical protein [Acidimicrobiales bacterium]